MVWRLMLQALGRYFLPIATCCSLIERVQETLFKILTFQGNASPSVHLLMNIIVAVQLRLP